MYKVQALLSTILFQDTLSTYIYATLASFHKSNFPTTKRTLHLQAIKWKTAWGDWKRHIYLFNLYSTQYLQNVKKYGISTS